MPTKETLQTLDDITTSARLETVERTWEVSEDEVVDRIGRFMGSRALALDELDLAA